MLQWNIGQGTLQPLFSDMLAAHHDIAANLFHDHLDELTKMLASSRGDQLGWTRSIQDLKRHRVLEPWAGLLQALGRTAEFQAIQANHAERIHQNAVELCGRYEVSTERALALMFDICVQNGSIDAATEGIIRNDFDAIPTNIAPMAIEVARLQSIANRRAEAAAPAYIEDVRVRKLTIANGTGMVHKTLYHLEEQFGIRLISTS